jgi:Chalcone isomerase-like
MKTTARSFAFLAILSTTLFGADNFTDKETNYSFPEKITTELNGKNYNLEATGVATRKKFFVKIYSVASYLQKPPANASGNILAQILSDENAKELTIKWARNVEGSKIQEGYYEAFKKDLPAKEYKALEKEINNFVKTLISDVVKGEIQRIRWFPGGIIQVTTENKVKGQIESKDFAKALWNIWFGPNSVVEKERLTSAVK